MQPRQASERYEPFKEIFMKTRCIILLTIILLNSFFVEGQTYHPLIKQNKFWTTMFYDITNLCFTTGGVQQYFFGDTIIQSKTYQKIASCNVISLCQCSYFCQPFAIDTAGNCANGGSISTTQFMREDTLLQQVYLLDLTVDSVEHLLFDFTLNVGDTLNTPFVNQPVGALTIDSIGQYPLLSGYGKIIYLHNGFNYIESIGDDGGLTIVSVVSTEDVATGLTCVKDDGNYIYSQQSSDCFGVVSLHDDNKPDASFTVIQEGNSIKINLKENQKETLLQIFDTSGKIVYSKILAVGESNVSLDKYQNGLYLYSLSEGLHTIRGKLILN